MSLAIIYINSYHDDGFYVKEANDSAISFRKYLPNATYYLFTNYEDTTGLTGFDKIIHQEFYVPDFLKNRVHLNGQMIVKHKVMSEMEEDTVLYVGSDTYALKEDVSQLPLMLDKFEIVAAHAPWRINTSAGNTSIPEIPVAFPEVNGDLILYRNNDRLKKFFKEWAKAYLDDMFSHTHDQGTLRYLLYNSDLRLGILPPEWNYRGDAYMNDTVILQNRFALHKYIKKTVVKRKDNTTILNKIKLLKNYFFK